MRAMFLAALAALVAMMATTTAEARRYKAAKTQKTEASFDMGWGSSSVTGSKSGNFWEADEAPQRRNRQARAPREVSNNTYERRSHHESVAGSGIGPRPGAWCGWYMRSRHGGGPEMNLAANWRRYGSLASPQVGAIVVWNHHVGEITGQASNGQWIVLSGNDSHRVRERPRSIAGASVRM